MRRTRRSKYGSRGTGPYVSPFADRTDRAACFEVSPYQVLCWREAYEDAPKPVRVVLAAVPVPGFATTFGAELTHRLCGVPVRPLPLTRHARLRAKLHDMVQIPDHVRMRCERNPALASTIALAMLTALEQHLRNMAKTPDRERAEQEKQAAKDLGLDGTPAPKVKVIGKSDAPSVKDPSGQSPKDGDEVLAGEGEGSGPQVDADGLDAGGGNGSDDSTPENADGLTEDEARAAEQAESAITGAIQDLTDGAQYARDTVNRAITDAMPEAVPDAWTKGGKGEGDGSGGEFTPSLTLSSVMAKHPEIKRVLALAGRLVPVLDRLAEDKRARSGAGRSRLENTTEIPRLTMNERASLAGLRGGIVAADTFRRVLEGSALGYQGEDPRGEGAIVICLDQSGSMFDGRYDDQDEFGQPSMPKQHWAQAVALALMVRASRSGRKVAIVPYDTRVKPELVRAFCKRPSVEAAVEALRIGSRMGGGTSWHAGVNAALDLIMHAKGSASHFSRADVIHITDGEPDTAFGHEAIRDRARHMNVRIHGIAVGRQAQAMAACATSPLALWSDTICAVTDTTVDSAAVQALGRI